MAPPFKTEKQQINGPAGAIELAAHFPESEPRAVAVIAHPHPLFGGTMDNKVVTTLARACHERGAATWRFNFRGVGGSAGTHDGGRGEASDMLAVIAHAREQFPGIPLWLAGFSFGGAVTLAAASEAAPQELILVAPAFKRLENEIRLPADFSPPETCLIIHGELDDVVPLADSMAWARQHDVPVLVVPQADHFFHQRLHIIKRHVSRLLAAAHEP